LVGYYPKVTVKEARGRDGAAVQQQYWHAFMGELISVMDAYHEQGGITFDLPVEYHSTSIGLATRFYPYICAFGVCDLYHKICYLNLNV
jgi:hypothetical protein